MDSHFQDSEQTAVEQAESVKPDALSTAEATPQKTDLTPLVALVHAATHEAQGDTIALLDILRLLERLHREITENAFQVALPQNRQELYKLLRVIEEEGGWPHIPRLKLQQLCAQLLTEA